MRALSCAFPSPSFAAFTPLISWRVRVRVRVLVRAPTPAASPDPSQAEEAELKAFLDEVAARKSARNPVQISTTELRDLTTRLGLLVRSTVVRKTTSLIAGCAALVVSPQAHYTEQC